MTTDEPGEIRMPIEDDGWHAKGDECDMVLPAKNRPAFSRSTQSIDVAIIGAGPYGLSVAAHLLDAGIDARVFGDPMAGWRHHMPKGMYLKSTFEASSLSAPERDSSLADYCASTGTPVPDELHPVPIGMFIDYGDWFQKRRVGDIGRIEIRNVAVVPNGFRLSLEDGEDVSARTVVAAAGHLGYAYSPGELRSLADEMVQPAALASHASQHTDFSRFSGRVVAVIGAGQSALESAALLREAGAEVHLLVRGRSILWGSPPADYRYPFAPIVKPSSPLGPGWSLFALSRVPELVAYLPPHVRLFLMRTVLGPSGAWWLRNRFGSRVNVALETTIEDARLSNGKISLGLRTMSGTKSTLVVDHVIAATGYRVDVGALRFLDPAVRRDLVRIKGTSAPQLSHAFESSVPGLYFTGLSAAPTFGPLMRFVCGTDFTARTIRRALVRS